MKIGIQTWGSRGDVNPFIALGQGLQRSGHTVTLYYTCFTNIDFTNHSLEGLIVKSTKEFCSKPIIYENVPYKNVFDMNVEDSYRYILNDIYSLFEEEIALAGEHLCKTNDLIIHSNLLYQLSYLAEKHNIPRITIHVDSNFVSIDNEQESADPVLNSIFLDRINEFRKKLRLPKINNATTENFCSPLLNLMIYSKVFGTEQESWDNPSKVCGYPELQNDENYVISGELESFLTTGNPPVFFSLGSLSFFEENITDILELFVKAVRLSGCRAIIQADWENINYNLPVDSDICKISYIPHNVIFPHCLCIVHHGGSGTSHATLLNGSPSIVIAYAWDQFTWGRRLRTLGAAPGLLKRKNVDEIQLAGEIRNIMVNPEYKYAADNCRRKMKRESGVKKAVTLIEEFTSAYRECECSKDNKMITNFR